MCTERGKVLNYVTFLIFSKKDFQFSPFPVKFSILVKSRMAAKMSAIFDDVEFNIWVEPNQIRRIQLIQTANLPCVESNDLSRRMGYSTFELGLTKVLLPLEGAKRLIPACRWKTLLCLVAAYHHRFELDLIAF